MGVVHDRPPKDGRSENWFRSSPSESCLVWSEVGTFLIRQGREIIVDPATDADSGLLRQAILGPAFGILLQQNGFFPLHASSININGTAIALAGVSGSGKSTLAAHLHSSGHALISDDISAINTDTDPPILPPGFPRFRLWPESVTNFGENPEALPQLHKGTEKRLIVLTDGFADSALPLKLIYFLVDHDSESIEILTPQNGLLQLMHYCYNVTLIQAAIGIQALMKQCASIAGSTKLFILKRRRSLDALPDLAAMVEAHLDRNL
ncbi:hypothetical protein ACFL4G_07455 [Thermodesulfobacteriota bacterium]